MPSIENLKVEHISKVQTGVIVANLGEIIEVDEYDTHYALIISRMDEKQVVRFEKDMFLVIFLNQLPNHIK